MNCLDQCGNAENIYYVWEVAYTPMLNNKKATVCIKTNNKYRKKSNLLHTYVFILSLFFSSQYQHITT